MEKDSVEKRNRPVPLSRRLSAIVELAGRGDTVCDVGCDHAHVPIRLLQEGRFTRAIGMDVIEGPLGKAAGNLALYGMEERVALRLSDGLDALTAGEADTLVVTGMGGTLMREILLREPEKTRSFSALVAGPQSDPDRVREAVRLLGFVIEDERLVYADGKYYNIIRAVRGAREGRPNERPSAVQKEDEGSVRGVREGGSNEETPAVRAADAEDPVCGACEGARTAEDAPVTEAEDLKEPPGKGAAALFQEDVPEAVRRQAVDLFGPVLLAKKDPMLHEFLVRRTAVLEKILSQVRNALEEPGRDMGVLGEANRCEALCQVGSGRDMGVLGEALCQTTRGRENGSGSRIERHQIKERHLIKERELVRTLEIYRAALSVYGRQLSVKP